MAHSKHLGASQVPPDTPLLASTLLLCPWNSPVQLLIQVPPSRLKALLLQVASLIASHSPQAGSPSLTHFAFACLIPDCGLEAGPPAARGPPRAWYTTDPPLTSA